MFFVHVVVYSSREREIDDIKCQKAKVHDGSGIRHHRLHLAGHAKDTKNKLHHHRSSMIFWIDVRVMPFFFVEELSERVIVRRTCCTDDSFVRTAQYQVLVYLVPVLSVRSTVNQQSSARVTSTGTVGMPYVYAWLSKLNCLSHSLCSLFASDSNRPSAKCRVTQALWGVKNRNVMFHQPEARANLRKKKIIIDASHHLSHPTHGKDCILPSSSYLVVGSFSTKINYIDSFGTTKTTMLATSFATKQFLRKVVGHGSRVAGRALSTQSSIFTPQVVRECVAEDAIRFVDEEAFSRGLILPYFSSL